MKSLLELKTGTFPSLPLANDLSEADLDEVGEESHHSSLTSAPKAYNPFIISSTEISKQLAKPAYAKPQTSQISQSCLLSPISRKPSEAFSSQSTKSSMSIFDGTPVSSARELEQRTKESKKELQTLLLSKGEVNVDVASSCLKIAEDSFALGDYFKALSYYTKALEIYYQDFHTFYGVIPQIYDRLGHLCQIRGKYNEALGHYNMAMNLRVTFLGEEHVDLTTSYDHLAQVFYHMGRYTEGMTYVTKSIGIKEKILPPKHPLMSDSLLISALILSCKEQFTEATAQANEALTIRISSYGDSSVSYAEVLQTLGLIKMLQKSHQEAKSYLTKALEIKTQFLGEIHPELPVIYNEIGRISYIEGNLNYAHQCIKNALKCREMCPVEHNLSAAKSYLYLGYIYADKREISKARDAIEKSQSIIKSCVGDSHPDNSSCLQALAYTFLMEENILKAEENLVSSFAILQSIAEEKSSTLLESSFILSALQSFSKRDSSLTSALSSNISLIISKYSEESPITANAFFSLGQSYFQAQQYEESVVCFLKALKQYNRIYGENSFPAGISTFMIGKAYSAQNKRTMGVEFLEKALRALETTFGSEHPVLVLILDELAQNIIHNKDYKRCLAYFERSAKITILNYGNTTPQLAFLYYQIGMIHKRLENYQAAAPYLKDSLKVQRLHLQFTASFAETCHQLIYVYKTLGNSSHVQKYELTCEEFQKKNGTTLQGKVSGPPSRSSFDLLQAVFKLLYRHFDS